MKRESHEALSEYLEARRQLKSGWDSFHRHALRQTFIHCRLSISHLMSAVIFLGEEEPGTDLLHQFLRVFGGELPVDKAENYMMIFQPPELKSIGPVNKGNLSESVSDWLVTRKISRSRAFEHLSLTQETFNLTTNLIHGKYPRFFSLLDR
jgi:hypothetical protein